MENKVFGATISAVVAIIMIGALLAPVISDAEKTTSIPHEYTNSTYNGYVGTYDIMDSFTIANGNEVNGNALVDTANTANRLVFTDTFYVTYRNTGAWQIIGLDGVKSGSDDLSCNASNGVAVFESPSLGSYTLEYSIAYGFVGATGGDYIINSSFTHNTFAYAESIGDFFAIAQYTSGETSKVAVLQDGKLTSGAVDGTVEYTSSSVDGMSGIISVDSLTASIEGVNFNLAILLVPAEITGYESTATSQLLSSILAIVIAGVLVMVISGFYWNSKN